MRDALDPEISDHDLPSWMRFDMHHWGHLSPNKPLTACGTACCIGGSMEMHLAGLTSKLDVGEVLALHRETIEAGERLLASLKEH